MPTRMALIITLECVLESEGLRKKGNPEINQLSLILKPALNWFNPRQNRYRSPLS